MQLIWCLIIIFSIAGCECAEVNLGDFVTYQHGVKGTVYKVDDKTLKITNFFYDGTGPDAFFYVGTGTKPIQGGVKIEYSTNKEDNILGRFSNDEVILTLPDSVVMSQLKWISVWCRAYKVNFGDLYFGDKLTGNADEALSSPKLTEKSEDNKSNPDNGSTCCRSEYSTIFILLASFVFYNLL